MTFREKVCLHLISGVFTALVSFGMFLGLRYMFFNWSWEMFWKVVSWILVAVMAAGAIAVIYVFMYFTFLTVKERRTQKRERKTAERKREAKGRLYALDMVLEDLRNENKKVEEE